MLTLLRNLALIATMVVSATAAQSQNWPTRSLRWVVGYPPGGGSDTIARVLAEHMSQTLGQPVIVDNRPGANTMIGADMVAKSAPDGYTMMIADNGTLVNNGALYKKLSYDPVADFAPISMIGRFQFVLLANAGTGIKDVAEFKRQVAAAPDKFNYASAGSGSPFHIGMEVIKQETGLSIKHVPYRGMAPAVQALLTGEVQFLIADIATAVPHIKTGKFLPIATATETRTALLPEVPTMKEVGLTSFPGWQVLIVPAQTPEDVKRKLNDALRAAMASPAATRLFQEKAVDPVLSTPAEFKAFQQAEIARWQKFIKERGISLE